ncbi:hypothetical protein [Lactiplantibacillus paraxiangfangensis]|uniref:hypothetical protein n=1 Tax=Lactiplantibacillus paraxiangfangensis TaxID=3076224 RepID=UPI0030C73DB5
MAEDTDELLDGTTFDEYHRDHVAQFTGFQANYKGTTFDNLIKYLDDAAFTRLQNTDEITKAREISYAHGLELDDIGDDLGIERNGVDDELYRFLLLSRMMSRDSKGTINELIGIAANLLGCDKSDVWMARNRHLDANGDLVGDPNTIDVKDIPYDKVKNMFLIDRLTTELERATVGATKINFVNLSVPLSEGLFIGMAPSFTVQVDL